jgi:hypothetical protein
MTSPMSAVSSTAVSSFSPRSGQLASLVPKRRSPGSLLSLPLELLHPLEHKEEKDEDNNKKKQKNKDDDDDRNVLLKEQRQKHKPFKRLSLDSVSTCSSRESSSSTATSSILMEIFYSKSKHLLGRDLDREECKEQDLTDCCHYNKKEDDIQSSETEQEHLEVVALSGIPKQARRLPHNSSPHHHHYGRRGSHSRSSYSSSNSGGESSLSSPRVLVVLSSRDDQTLPSLASYHLSSLASGSSSCYGGGGGDSFSTSASIVSSCSSSLAQALFELSVDLMDSDREEEVEEDEVVEEKEECKESDYNPADIVRTRSIPLDDVDTPQFIDCRRKVTQRRRERRAAREARRIAREAAAKEAAATAPPAAPLSPSKRLRPILKRS